MGHFQTHHIGSTYRRLGFVLGLISLLTIHLHHSVAQIQVPGIGSGSQVNNPYQLNHYSTLGGLQYPGLQYQQQQQPSFPGLFQNYQNSILDQSTFQQQPQLTSYVNPDLNQNRGLLPRQQVPTNTISRSVSSEPISAQLLPGDPPTPTRGGFSLGNGSYILEWEVNDPVITFVAKRRGIGFVGFAISPSGGMSGADIFIAGIGPTGMPFASDYHHEYQPGGVGTAVPDASNDYQVLDISEAGGYTSVKFQRLLDTRDVKDDHVIENREQNILWSIGPPSRTLEYHGPNNRGVVRINLLNPPQKFKLSKPLS